MKYMKIETISSKSKYYPKELKSIKELPEKLYAIGNIKLLQNQKISIIGSRKNTEYGKTVTLNFAKNLSNKGYTIVSGLAEGIDSYAHIGGMLGKSKTIAVLPCGFKYIFPEQNYNLYKEIISNGGLAISEYAIDTYSSKENFIKRNRIVGGISKGILVVEGDYRSGTTITAHYATESKIPVFCIPGNINNTKSYTPNLLVKQGHILVTNENDIINKIENKNLNVKKREKKVKLEEGILEEYNKIYKKQEFQKNENIVSQKEEIIKKYDIYTIITETPIYINDIVYKSKKDISQINYELTMLILEGYIQELPGKKYVKVIT